MKIAISGGALTTIYEQCKSMPDFLLYDGLSRRGHEVVKIGPVRPKFILNDVQLIHAHHFSRVAKYAR